MVGSILIVISLVCLLISVIIGLSELINMLGQKKHKFNSKSVLLFMGLYILFFIPGLVFLNM